jgi:hypothetical protein
LIGLLGGLVGDRIGYIHVVIAIIATTFVKLLVNSKEEVINDHFGDAFADDELECVRGQVHVHV